MPFRESPHQGFHVQPAVPVETPRSARSRPVPAWCENLMVLVISLAVYGATWAALEGAPSAWASLHTVRAVAPR